ncbi:serine hydrolase domain-containing protein [Rhodococcus sp. NPDC057529]|uniref:serine hydrolase domain-containing protein n=1 Tax=Rhodococcus sp. NPDC057529 TaxID=3346158 RepID=UPI0036702442
MTTPQPVLKGLWHPGLDKLRAEIESNLADHTEIGMSLSIDVAGESFADVWGGWRDAERTVEWTEDTLVNVWSTTKTVSSLALLMLVDREQVDINAPVSHYWPEFASQGKENVLVRHIMGHASGVSGWETPFHYTEAFNHVTSAARLASQAPWWTPGSASGYHATNYGHLVGEIVRRVTGRSLGQFIADEIAGPLGADFHLGLDDSDFSRVATIYPPVGFDLADSLPDAVDASKSDLRAQVAAKTLAGSIADIGLANTAPWRRAEIGGSNGHTNARALNTIFRTVTLGGSANGIQLLSPETVDLIFDTQTDGVDLYLNLPIRWGVGYALPSAGVPFIPEGKTCFWGGWGGSMVVMDLDRQVTFTYVMNQMQPGTIGSDVVAKYFDIAYRCVEDLHT